MQRYRTIVAPDSAQMTHCAVLFICAIMENKRILVLADFACASGFSTVSENIIAQVLKENSAMYTIDIVGINYHGDPNSWQSLYPQVRLFSALHTSGGDPYGRKTLLSMVASGKYDVVFILQDTFIVQTFIDELLRYQEALPKKFKIVYYFPIDAKPQKDWIESVVGKVDYPVAYTKYGWECISEISPEIAAKVTIVPHGVDTKTFFPAVQEEVKQFAEQYFSDIQERTLLVNVNRNQPRKDIGRSLQVIKELRATNPEYILYLHMEHRDAGIDIFRTAASLGLMAGEDFVTTHERYKTRNFPAPILNLVYNCADAVITTTLGEGWGLSLTEAMATRTPVVAPRNSVIPEVLAHGKYGLLVDCTNPLIIANDEGAVRYQTDICSMVEALKRIPKKGNRSTGEFIETHNVANAAYTHAVRDLSWDTVGIDWRRIFREAACLGSILTVPDNIQPPQALVVS